jgi:CubicO group peptidase (beta-lactamase class C family)
MMNSTAEINWDSLDRLILAALEKEKVPGAAVGIFNNGEIHAVGHGITNIDHPLPVTSETLFQVGSISKTFTTTIILRLVEMGKLDLDAPIRTYVPEFRVADEITSARVSLKDLLTHRAGWAGDFFHDTGPGDDALYKYMRDMSRLDQIAPLGTVWSYNNSAFYLAGYLIEVITGRSYQDVLKEMILEPLGLRHCFLDPGDLITYRFAVGHELVDGELQVARPWTLPRSLYPAGGIVTNVFDLLQYAQFHLGDGTTENKTRLLKTETLRTMQSPHVTIWGEKETMGITWFIRDIDGVRTISHEGGTNGQISLLLFVPERTFGFAILTNSERGDALIHKVGNWILHSFLGLDQPEPAPINYTAEDLSEYVGRYVQTFAELELGILSGRLIAQRIPKGGFPAIDSPVPPPPPPMTLAPCEKDRMVILDGEAKGGLIDVIRKPDGSIGWLRSGYRIYARLFPGGSSLLNRGE